MLKTGKEEIVYLLSKVIQKHREQTGQAIIQNTNRKNYEVIAIALSSISNELPSKWEEFGTDIYQPEVKPINQEYPYRKYDITGGQIKDALNGIVSHPRSFLVDSCYIYLYGKGRKAFEQEPIDDNLLAKPNSIEEQGSDVKSDKNDKSGSSNILLGNTSNQGKSIFLWKSIAMIFGIAIVASFFYLTHKTNEWNEIKADLNILTYQPTNAEIDSLEGVWLCYTGSPQARISDNNRYHKVVPNLVYIKYKDGYFTYNRFGASFNHIGYLQFESPGIVSVYSKIKNNTGKTESPRHSLFNLYASPNFLSAISSSWNFDVGDKNMIIGIREIYIKQGKGGTIEEVINEVENASCQCKIIRWLQENNQVKTFYLKNQLLDSLAINEIKPLINENSILLSAPQDGLLMSKDTTRR